MLLFSSLSVMSRKLYFVKILLLLMFQFSFYSVSLSTRKFYSSLHQRDLYPCNKLEILSPNLGSLVDIYEDVYEYS